MNNRPINFKKLEDEKKRDDMDILKTTKVEILIVNKLENLIGNFFDDKFPIRIMRLGVTLAMVFSIVLIILYAYNIVSLDITITGIILFILSRIIIYTGWIDL